MGRRSFVIVHNITGPYRLHLFRVLWKKLAARDIDFHVHFMATGHSDRKHWTGPDPSLVPFPHTFWRDIGPKMGDTEWHLNPGIVRALTFGRVDYLMLGGVWDSLTNVLLSGIGRRAVGIAWIEGNTSTPGKVGGVVSAAKRALLRRFDFVAVPGKEGREFARLFMDPAAARPEPVVLPNIVDERMFTPSWEMSDAERAAVKTRLSLPPGDKLMMWPARLLPAKGVPEFLSRWTPSDLEGWHMLIIGEGPLREAVRATIDARGIAARVTVMPNVPYPEIPKIYSASDLFLLPSMHDPNPLSVVEAMHSGLPILLSKRVGNYPEALEEGSNGWGVNPVDDASVRRAIEAATRSTPAQLRAMGQASVARARAFWSSEPAVDAFLEKVLR